MEAADFEFAVRLTAKRRYVPAGAEFDLVAHEIAAGRFYKRPGKWCSWCDYLPVCVKDEKRVKETLVRIAHIKPNR